MSISWSSLLILSNHRLLWSDYPQLPRIRILSMDARWVTPVLNEIIRGRMANENPEAYFERGSTIAKNLIEKFLDGEEPPSETETCENNLGDFQACPKCLEVVRSRSLRSIGDSKMCLFCCTGSREILGPTQTTRSGLNTMEKVLLFKIYGSFKGDENKGMTAPRDQEDRLRLASIVWEELEKDRRVPGQAHEDPPRYEDTYVKQVVQRHSMRGTRSVLFVILRSDKPPTRAEIWHRQIHGSAQPIPAQPRWHTSVGCLPRRRQGLPRSRESCCHYDIAEHPEVHLSCCRVMCTRGIQSSDNSRSEKRCIRWYC